MDPTLNPFAPGAGTQPPELSGRQDIVEGATVALGRVVWGEPARSQMRRGFGGGGRTFPRNEIAQLGGEKNSATFCLEAPGEGWRGEMLVPPLRSLLFKLSRLEKTKDVARRGLAVLR